MAFVNARVVRFSPVPCSDRRRARVAPRTIKAPVRFAASVARIEMKTPCGENSKMVTFVTSTIRQTLVGAVYEMEQPAFEDQKLFHTREFVGAIMRARMLGISQSRLQLLLGMQLSELDHARSTGGTSATEQSKKDCYEQALRVLLPRWTSIVYLVMNEYLSFPSALRPKLEQPMPSSLGTVDHKPMKDLVDFALGSIKRKKSLPTLRRELVARSALDESARFGHADGAIAYFALIFSVLYKKSYLESRTHP